MVANIFLSHISDEGAYAKFLKERIEEAFLGHVEVFVASSPMSLRAGKPWLGTIHAALERADGMLVLCGPDSIARPWINFEAGAGWMKGISVIPLLHGGLTTDDLTPPIGSLQALELPKAASFRGIFELAAEISKSKFPSVDFAQMEIDWSSMKAPSQTQKGIDRALVELRSAFPDLFKILAMVAETGDVETTAHKLPEEVYSRNVPALEALANTGQFEYRFVPKYFKMGTAMTDPQPGTPKISSEPGPSFNLPGVGQIGSLWMHFSTQLGEAVVAMEKNSPPS